MDKNRKKYEKPIKTISVTALLHGKLEILHSEYRDINIKNKVYAFALFYDINAEKDEFFISDIYDKEADAIKDIQKQIKSKVTKLLIKDIKSIK